MAAVNTYVDSRCDNTGVPWCFWLTDCRNNMSMQVLTGVIYSQIYYSRHLVSVNI